MTFLHTDNDTLRIGRTVLSHEAKALMAVSDSLDEKFTRAVELILQTKGRIIVAGIGKSGHIGRKIAATLASTGTLAYFVHPSEASHGDLGMIAPEDCLLILSNSGETSELVDMLVYARRHNINILCIGGRTESTLVKHSTVGLILPTISEASPEGVVPTSSSVMALALGDALAVALMQKRNFTAKDFSNFHPGGKLGAKLSPVAHFMHEGDRLPLVHANTSMSDTLLIMSQKGFGIAGVINENNTLIGVISDGDLRRHMHELLSKTAQRVMTKNPVTISPQNILEDALCIMQEKKITAVFIVKEDSKQPIGILHIHDCLRAGLK